jgi:hypothetical protein
MQWSEVDAALRQAMPRADEGDEVAAWSALAPLETGAKVDATAAHGLAIALAHRRLGRERRLQLAATLLARWPEEPEVLAALGGATETQADLRFLNAPPPSDPLFVGVAMGLDAALRTVTDEPRRVGLARGLATAARVCGRGWDEACERAHRELLRLRPDRWQEHYNYGLFLKNRGRFSEAVDANRAAARLGGADDNSVVWNLGISATAVGDGETPWSCGGVSAASWSSATTACLLGPGTMRRSALRSAPSRRDPRPRTTPEPRRRCGSSASAPATVAS